MDIRKLLTVLILFTFIAGLSRIAANRVKAATGLVTSVYKVEAEQIILKIDGFKCRFLLSSGPGVSGVDHLRQNILGRKVFIQYKDRWTPLDPSGAKEIASLSIGNDIYYPIK